jgi:predicted secreted Zn-dependent protease
MEATIEQDDDPQIHKARKRVAQKVEAMRLKRERAAARDAGQQTPVYIPAWIEPFPPSN